MKISLACSMAMLALAGCNPSTEPNDTGAAPMVDTGMLPVDTGVVPADTGVDAPTPMVDSGVDAATPTDDAATTPDSGMTASCGTAMPALPGSGTEGLVIARDGTIYYSVGGGVARLTPDGTNDPAWLTIPGATTIWGLALDATNTHLFIGDPSTHQLRVATNLATTPTQTALAAVTAPNGVTVGPDGAVYVSDFRTAGTVQRVDATTGVMTAVTASAISGADGVAFTDDGHLLVTSYNDDLVYSLALDAAHHETARTTVATGVAGADGVALDASGVMWVGGGTHLYRIGTGGTPDMTMTTPAGTANLEWGAGPLGCHDLYVATGSGLRRIATTVGQRAVPWH